MRCDLHVHSWYSGRAEIPVLERVGRECYSHPLDVYERAQRQGMDLVTLTDHDTFEAFLAFLAEQRLPVSVNHLFSALTGTRELADLRRPLARLPLIEALEALAASVGVAA